MKGENNENVDKEVEEYTDDDFVLYKKGGKIISGGFNVKSILMSKGLPTMTTYNHPHNYESNNVSDLFKNLVVPSGLYYISVKNMPDKNGFNYENFDKSKENLEVVNDDIYEKLLGLATVEQSSLKNKKRNTRKMKTDNSIKKNKTKKSNKMDKRK